MADFDSTIKVLADRNAADYVRWLLGPSYQLIKTEGTELPATKRFADTVYHVKGEEDNPFIFHIEFQGQKSEKPMNFRMLEYNVRLLEKHKNPVCGIVIYLVKGADAGDNGIFRSICPIDDEEVLTFRYNIVKLWEVDGNKLLREKMLGVYPLLGLTTLDEPEKAFRQIVSEIRQIPDRTLSLDMLFGFQLLSTLAHSRDLLDALIRREEIMESPLYREIYQEGMQEGFVKGIVEGKEEGSLETAQADIIEILLAKFNLSYAVISKLEKQIEAVNNLSTLRGLLVDAAKSENFSHFVDLLNELEM